MFQRKYELPAFNTLPLKFTFPPYLKQIIGRKTQKNISRRLNNIRIALLQALLVKFGKEGSGHNFGVYALVSQVQIFKVHQKQQY